MFMQEKEVVLEGIAKLGDYHCCYGGGEWIERRCDCKYGGPNLKFAGGEQTGCPELRMSYKLIEALTPHEFTRLVKRSGGVISTSWINESQ